MQAKYWQKNFLIHLTLRLYMSDGTRTLRIKYNLPKYNKTSTSDIKIQIKIQIIKQEYVQVEKFYLDEKVFQLVLTQDFLCTM